MRALESIILNSISYFPPDLKPILPFLGSTIQTHAALSTVPFV
jgi:hypothetical protein